MAIFSGKGIVSSFGKEWVGLIGAFFWFFSLMCSYDGSLMNGTATLTIYMLVLAFSLLGSAVLAERKEVIFHRLVFPAGLVGVALTASLGFLPDGFLQVAFCLIPAMASPLLCRRLFGVLTTVRPHRSARGYISAVSVTILLHMVWILLPVPDSVRFALCAFAALIGLWRAASTPIPAQIPSEQGAISHRMIPEQKLNLGKEIRRAGLGFLFLLVLSAFNIFCSFIHTAVVRGTYLEADIFAAIAYLLMPLSFLFFAWMTDRGQSRCGFLIGLGLVFAGCCVAVLPSESLWKAPLLILGEFGGTITEYTFLTVTLTVFRTTKRRYPAAVAGLILHTLLASLPSWTADLFMTRDFLDPNLTRGFVVFGAATAFLLVILYYWLWGSSIDRASEMRDPLLADGVECNAVTRGEIPGKQMNEEAQPSECLPPQTKSQLDAQALLRFAVKYQLTDRQSEILSALLEGGTSREIAQRLFVTEATVKFHVHNILAKTGHHNRTELQTALLSGTDEED